LSDSNKSLSLASVGQGTTSSIVQWLLCLISFGIAASALNNNWNGEKFIALETDVLWLHIVLGITSSHLQFFSPSKIFLIASKIKVLALSTVPLDYEC
jgi:vacuolar-type H+-ATPase subunit I/STV1